MVWQDVVTGVGGLVLAASALPTVLDREARVPLASSLLFAAVLAVYVLTFATLGYLSVAGLAAQVAAWAFIAARRRLR